MPPSLGQYAQPHTLEWAQKIGSFDGFVMVTPEYNHSTSGALKNAIDFLFAEWNNKAVGFVSYGSVGGARAVEHLRLIAGELMMADVRAQVTLSLITDFENYSVFKPADHHAQLLGTVLDRGLGPKIQELRTLPLIGGFLTEERVRDVRRAFQASILAQRQSILDEIERGLERGLDVPGLVETKVAAFPVERLEALILEVAGRELRAITWLGGVLGAIIGLGQVAVVWFLG